MNGRGQAASDSRLFFRCWKNKVPERTPEITGKRVERYPFASWREALTCSHSLAIAEKGSLKSDTKAKS